METRDSKQPIRIQLTPEQAREIKVAIGRDAEAIELTVQELEQRVVPSYTTGGTDFFRLAGNSNETLLAS